MFRSGSQVTQDIGSMFLPNIGLILVNILDKYWSETLANVEPILALTDIGSIFGSYQTKLDQYCLLLDLLSNHNTNCE